MRAVLPSPAPSVDLHAFYGEGWLQQGGLRVNFVSAVDGAAQADGLSRGLQTPGDNAVFAALRDLADVVLVGSGTALAERYRAVHPRDERLATRRAYGLPETLPVAVMSRSLRLDPAAGLFTEADPRARTIVLTCAAAPAERRAALAQVADLVECGEVDVDPSLARAALVERGHRRILSEGGPTVFARMVQAGAVDELCLSVSPLLMGPGAARITDGPAPWAEAATLTLAGLLEEDSALFLRYRVGD